MCRRRIAVITLLAMAATARAQLKVERVPAETAAATFSFSVRDVTLNDAVAQFQKQTGIDVVLDEPNNPEAAGGPTVVYDIDFTNLGRNEAVREFARRVSLGVNPNGNGTGPVRLSRNSWSNDTESRDTAGVVLAYVSRTESFPPNPNQPNQLSLQFRIYGGRRPITGTTQLEITEAIDDQGRTLESPERNANNVSFDNGSSQPSVQVQRSLALPTPLPKKLKKVAGTATLMRPKTLLRVTADALPDKAIDSEFDGGTISVGPPEAAKDDPKKFELPITLTRGNMTPERWSVLQRQINSLNQTAEIRSADGERLWLQSRGWSGSGDAVNIRTLVTRNGDFGERPNAKPMARPAKFKWDVVGETVGETLPFELNDVELP